MRRFFHFCLFTFYYLCSAREPPMVNIPDQGIIMGKEMSMIRTQRILAYLGIPYAQPPLERLRFAPPVTDPLPSWEGVRNGTEFYPACLQSHDDFTKRETSFLHLISDLNYEVSEDCLYLNIFTPFGGHPPLEGYATIVWFHPGNFTTGNPAMWNPFTIVYRQRVVVVTLAFRLNVMGFFTSNDGEATGNYGIKDQQAAMVWIKKNIKLFNGNPDNISLMGYGSGAVSIGIHMTNKQSQELFTKAIVMSGNFIHPSAIKNPHEDKGLIEKLIANFGCYPKPTSALMVCLRRANANALVSLTADIDWKPLIDTELSNDTAFLPELPKNFLERGDYYRVPLLTGYTDMEDVLAIEGLDPQNVPDKDFTREYMSTLLAEIVGKDFQTPNETDSSCVYNYDHIMDSVLFFYNPNKPIAEADKARKLVSDFNTDKNYGSSTFLHATYNSKDQPTYYYRFDMKPATLIATAEIAEWVSVPHLFDLLYVWGIPYWATLPEDQEWDIRDKRTSDIIMSFWTNFAKTSNPTENSIYPILWEPFTKDEPSILIIDRNFSMSNSESFNYKSVKFWNDYFPKVVNIATQCCNATDTAGAIYDISTNVLINYLCISALTFLLVR